MASNDRVAASSGWLPYITLYLHIKILRLFYGKNVGDRSQTVSEQFSVVVSIVHSFVHACLVRISLSSQGSHAAALVSVSYSTAEPSSSKSVPQYRVAVRGVSHLVKSTTLISTSSYPCFHPTLTLHRGDFVFPRRPQTIHCLLRSQPPAGVTQRAHYVYNMEYNILYTKLLFGSLYAHKNYG